MKSFAKLIEDLGGTTYTCYMELGQPEDISNLYFSKYENFECRYIAIRDVGIYIHRGRSK